MIRSRFSFFLFSLIFSFAVLPSSTVSAAISLPWQTTFDCPEWNQGSGSLNCDGISPGGDWDCGNGTGEQITFDANYPGGRGGRGQRHWLGASADNSGGLQIRFNSPQKEFWGRWYSRFQRGMDTTGRTMMFKMLYLHGAGTSNIGYLLFPETRDQVYYYEQNGGHVIHRSTTGGWHTVYGSGVSDGSWFRVDVHFKAETAGRSDGVLQIWINGRLVIDSNQAQFGSPGGFDGFMMGSNHKGHNDEPTCMYVDFDDIAISNTGYIGDISGSDINEGGNIKGIPAPGNLKIIGNGTSSSSDVGEGSTEGSSNLGGVLLFEEKFDDASFGSRGWYDNTNCQISTAEHISGSNASLQFRFPLSATTPTSGGAMRRKFAASDEVYLSYHVKYSSNWQGSNRSYHPHEILLLTNSDGDYSNLANTHLTTYIEQNEGVPQIAIQDGLNVDQSRINQDLTYVTENRAVAGCNGSSDGYSGSCYSNGTSYVNWKHWKATDVYFQDSLGPRYKNDWHHIQAYIKMNSITNGIANADGIVRYWYDGVAVINQKNVMLRTGSRSTMKFNQLILGPYIGDGSPVDQTFWIDDLVVRTSAP